MCDAVGWNGYFLVKLFRCTYQRDQGPGSMRLHECDTPFVETTVAHSRSLPQRRADQTMQLVNKAVGVSILT